MSIRKTISFTVARTRKYLRQRIAALWNLEHRLQYRIRKFLFQYGGMTFSIILLILVVASFYLSPSFQTVLESHYPTEDSIQELQQLLLNVGTALIGATAIVTSLVLFAMQVNIERMPHGLFRRLSTDRRLLGAFAFAFLFAIGVAVLSTFMERNTTAGVLIAAVWSVILILLLFLYAYRRALVLVNPLQQIQLLLQDTRKDLDIWGRRAHRVLPLLEPDQIETADSPPAGLTHDPVLTAYFQINSHWTDEAARGIRFAMSFARRYSEQGDYEVSDTALNAVVAINSAYIEVKGKTFYTNPPLIEDPRSRDTFITETLEHMRQNVQGGIIQHDEQKIEQTLQALASLVQVYLNIDYSSPYASKSHANLAAGYLNNAVQAVIPHDMADVLLEGVRLMGRSAQHFLIKSKPDDIALLTQRIALIACTGCTKENYRPVTMEGMAQLAILTFDVIRCKNPDTRHAIQEIRRNVAQVSQLFLKVPDSPLSNTHTTYLGPYYSSTSMESLQFWLTSLINNLSQAQADNEDAQTVVRNVEKWADGLYITTKELLLSTIDAKSHFTITIIQWITGVTELLLVLSNAPACDSQTQKNLQDHACWLIATLTWIPDDKDSVKFVEIFQLTEALFDAAMSARNRGCDDVSKNIGKYLLSWTFKGGRYITGWGVLDRGLCACAVFALMGDKGDVAALKTDIRTRLQDDCAPEREVLEHAARRIHQKADNLWEHGHWSSGIDEAMSQLDYNTLAPLLNEIATTLVSGEKT